MDKHLFISYKHEDSDFAEVLINRVEKAGFKTWVDSDKLYPGEDWRTGIDESIKNALALIVIMTPEAKASEYVTYEWAFARGAGVKVIPILYRSTQLHPRLEALQYLDFTTRTNRPWDALLNVLRNTTTTVPSDLHPTNQEHSPASHNNHQATKESWLNRGAVFLERKDYQEALEAYKQAILLDHNEALAYSGKSEALYRLERPKEALDASNQAISLNPDLAEAWKNKGNALSGLKRDEEALTAYDQALRLDPTYALAWRNKGISLHDLKRYDEALAAYEQALLLDPNYTDAWNSKGAVFSALKRYDEALNTYEQVLRLDPNYVFAWHNKGYALWNLNRPQDALAAFEQALRLDPNYTSAWNGKGGILSELKRHEEAIISYDKTLRLDPK